MKSAVSVWAGVRVVLVSWPTARTSASALWNFAEFSAGGGAWPELIVARQEERPSVLLARAHRRPERGRGRLPDARRRRRWRVGDVDRGRVEPVPGPLRQ